MLSAGMINPPIKAILSAFLRVDDREVQRIPMQGPLILVTNHINSLDAPVGFSHLHPRPLTAFVKEETWKNPFLGMLFDAWDTIPIRRGEVDLAAFRKAQEALANKKIVIIAPEGTRSKTGRLNMGFPGITFLALRSRAPILPVVFYGNEDFPSKLRLFSRVRMVIKVGQPFKIKFGSSIPDRETRQTIADEVMYEIAKLLPEKNRGYYSDFTLYEKKYVEYLL